MAKSKVEFKQLEVLHKVSVIVFIILAGLSVWLIKTGSFSLTTNYLIKDELASTTTTVMVPAARTVMDINLRYALPVVLGIGVLLHSLTIMRWRKPYEKALKNRLSAPRWLILGVLGGLLVEVVGLISGVRDITTLKVMGLSVVMGCVLGYVAEQAAVHTKQAPKLLFWTSILAKALPWLFILSSLVGTWVYGGEQLHWYVYAAAASLLIFSVLEAVNLWRSLNQRGVSADYLLVERNYLWLSLVSTTIVSLCLIVGLK